MGKLGSFLREKKFGLPVWAWVLIIGGLIFAVYYYYKKKAVSSGANASPLDSGAAAQNISPDAGAPVDTGSASPDASGIGVPSGGGMPFGTDGNTVPWESGAVSPLTLSTIPDQTSSNPVPNQPAVSSSLLKIAETPVSAKTQNFAQAAQARTAAGRAAGVNVPFGGVTGIQRLKNGATVTTYASGRKVEQARGKSAYVIKK